MGLINRQREQNQFKREIADDEFMPAEPTPVSGLLVPSAEWASVIVPTNQVADWESQFEPTPSRIIRAPLEGQIETVEIS